MPFNHFILYHPLLLLPSIFPSIRVFTNELALCIRWPKYWSFSFSFSISPSNEYSGLISFWIDWFDLLSVQRNLKSFLQHHSSKTSILQCSAFFYCPALTSVHEYWKNYWKMLCSVAKSRPILCYLIDCSTLGFLVLHFPEFAHIYAFWVSDDIQSSHPLSPSSPPALSLSQHQGLF